MKELHEFASQEEVNWEEDFEEQRRKFEISLSFDRPLLILNLPKLHRSQGEKSSL